MKTKLLSEAWRGAIVGMHTRNMSIHCIVAFLGMAQSTIFIVWKNFRNCGTFQLIRSSDRPPKLNMHDKRELGHIFS